MKILTPELVKQGRSFGDMFDKLAGRIDLGEIMKRLVMIIYEKENNTMEDSDYLLNGLLNIVELFLIKFPDVLPSMDREQLLKFLLTECLFKFEGGILIDGARYLNTRIRQSAMEL